jgi:nucleotide-binding universal stress UspA family protein
MAVTHRNVLVPLTDAQAPERVMETACTLADEGARVTAVFVIEISPLLPLDACMDEEEAHARRFLRRAEAVGDAYGVRVVPRLVRARDAGTAILEVAEEEGSELLVIGTKRQRVRGLAKHVLRKATCRVLVVSI